MFFDLCSERLLDNEERFVGRNGHRFAEIWDRGDGDAPIYRSGDLEEKEISNWVHEDRSANGPIQSGLRVLLSPKPSGKSQQSSSKLPYSRSTYLSLARAWRIPSSFLRAVSQKLSIVTQCSVSPLHPESPTSSPTAPWFTTRLDGDDRCDEEMVSKISDAAHCLLV
ncbi:hypothetical protein CC80DRAFT_291886 [Byssothecium circinans]|uniref:Uncharacterized protein n=1 Tax=Byssothecium circinans TaxID=147558 RepID=A0A6A5U6M5_9PLEO|nr:hypothetical protein CC80DRAFT_291886 [Byssothecium circinans]